jgi:hypothetical protein
MEQNGKPILFQFSEYFKNIVFAILRAPTVKEKNFEQEKMR